MRTFPARITSNTLHRRVRQNDPVSDKRQRAYMRSTAQATGCGKVERDRDALENQHRKHQKTTLTLQETGLMVQKKQGRQ